MDTLWTIQLLGGLRAECGDRVITRFPTRRAAALLAYLAYYRDRAHPREVLIELLWPGSDLEIGRKSLSVALSSLRQALEESGDPIGPVLIADRFNVQLNPLRVTTDVASFETAIQAAGQADNDARRIELLTQAIALYRGPLLPGYYEGWIASEQERLAEQYCTALIQLSTLQEQTGDLPNALENARRAVSVDPLREEASRQLMRLYAATGQNSGALRLYHELERALRQELNAPPSAATRALADQLRSDTGAPLRSEETGESLAGKLPSVTSALHSFLPSSAPPTVQTSQTPRIPAPLNRFIGREEEIARIEAMLQTAHARLVTLTGPGGSGKTRLAIEVAVRLKVLFGQKVWFVSLYDTSDPNLIMDKILTALGASRSSHIDPLDQVAEALGDQPTLLVLDNFEHLVEEGAQQVRKLLQWAPRLTCVITSRQRLNLSGEQEFAVLPLPVPTSSGGEGEKGRKGDKDIFSAGGNSSLQGLEAKVGEKGAFSPLLPHSLSPLLSCPSVQLFVDRARAVRPDFQVTPENASTVAQLCTALEGIPLAIELAAARVQVMTPEQMLAQLEDRFSFLISRNRDVEARHRTLRAAIDWSYRLLSPELQRFFNRLSVFRGGWTVEAAEFVCSTDEGLQVLRSSGVQEKQKTTLAEEMQQTKESGASEPEYLNTRIPEHLALDCLEHLRECSLVLVEECFGTMRFRMLDTLREYGREQLSPEETELLRARHCEWFLALAEQAFPHLQGPNQITWLNRLEAEYHNLRVALEWNLSTGERGKEKGESQTPQTQSLSPFPLPLSPSDEVGLRLAIALQRYWSMRGYFNEGSGWLDRALAQGGSPELRARALIGAGEFAHFLSDHLRAETLFREGLSLYKQLGDRQGMARALHGLGLAALYNSGFPAARTLLEESLSLFRAVGDHWGAAMALNNLGDTYSNAALIRPLQEESLALFRRLGDKQGIAFALYSLGRAASCQDDHASARLYTDESLALLRELGSSWGIAMALIRLGEISVAQGDFAAAQVSYEQALETCRAAGFKTGIGRALHRLGELAMDQGNFARARALFEESLAPLQERGNQLAVAQLLGSLGYLARKEGDWERARTLLQESLTIWQEYSNKAGIGMTLYCLAGLAQDQNDSEQAITLYKDSIANYQEAGADRGILSCLEGLASSYAAQGQLERAALLFGAAQAQRDALRYIFYPSNGEEYERSVAETRAALGEAAWTRAWDRGRAMTLNQATDYALDERDLSLTSGV